MALHQRMFVNLSKEEQSHQDQDEGVDESLKQSDDLAVLDNDSRQGSSEQTVARTDLEAQSSTRPSSPA